MEMRTTDEKLKKHDFDLILSNKDKVVYKRVQEGLHKEKIEHIVVLNRHGSISSYREKNKHYISLPYNINKLFMQKVKELGWQPKRR